MVSDKTQKDEKGLSWSVNNCILIKTFIVDGKSFNNCHTYLQYGEVSG